MVTVGTSDGTVLHYETCGSGRPPLVFVHGWCSNLRHWRAQVDHFARDHRVLAVDRRGHGRSAVPATGYDADQHAADLAEVLEAEALDRAVVVGHAGGAPTVLRLAVDRPDLVAAVVSIDTIVSPAADLTDPDDRAGRALAGLIGRLDAPGGVDELAAMYRDFFVRPDAPAARQAIIEAAATPIRVATAELASLTIDTLGLAAQVTQPVLWLSGAPPDEDRLVATFADVTFALVTGSGHFPHIEAPDQTNDAIERFVRRSLGEPSPGPDHD